MSAPKKLSVFETDVQLSCARFSPDGAILAAGGHDATVRRWRVGEKEITPLPHVKGHHGWTSTVAFHPKEPWLLSGDTWGQLRAQTFAEDEPKTLWQLDQAHDGWLRQIAISTDGARIATCGRDQTVRLWTPEGKMLTEHRHDDDVFAIAFAPDDSHLAFGDQHGHLHSWDFSAKKITRTFDATVLFKTDRIQDIGGLRVLAFLPDGTLVAAGTTPDKGATIQSTPTMLFFDFATGALRHQFTYGTVKDGFIEDLTLHPSGAILAVTSGDPGNGRLLQIRPLEKEAFDASIALPNCHAIALHPDGKRLAITSTNRNSNGNGRVNAKDGTYAVNTSPVNLFELLT